jgi:hypothetical protein
VVSDAWRTLSVYESAELCTRFHSGRDPNAAAAVGREIASHVAQAREYFASAADASELIRPLLLYYGVLSASRALVLFASRHLRETNLKKSHGVDDVQWSQALAAGPSVVGDLLIRVTGGTFMELAAATANAEHVRLARRGNLLEFPVALVRTGGAESFKGASMRVRDVLGRLPDLADLYAECFGVSPACHPASIVLEAPAGLPEDQPVAVSVQVTPRRRDTTPVGAAMPLGEPQGLHVVDNADGSRTAAWRVTVDTLQELGDRLPPAKNSSVGRLFAVDPLDGRDFSTLLLLYLCAYILSMLVRYYPSAWMRLMSRQDGDAAYPILRAATELIADRFPTLLVREFDRARSSLGP